MKQNSEYGETNVNMVKQMHKCIEVVSGVFYLQCSLTKQKYSKVSDIGFFSKKKNYTHLHTIMTMNKFQPILHQTLPSTTYHEIYVCIGV